jgi:excinuclease UvrABC nuclease subunit
MPTELLTQRLPFEPLDPEAALAQLPHGKAVFALYGEDPQAEPYIGLTADLRRRLERLLRPAKGQTKRLQLVSRVRQIAWRETGSEFESHLVQFALLEQAFGLKALERMKLRSPAFVRFHGGNPYPRLTITNKPNWKEAQWAFGPFPSRAAAERYADEMLKLFLLRRCEFNLDPDPAFPGCVYSEMKMCLAPCFKGCTEERYAEEAEAVLSFLATHGESKLAQIRTERDRASEELEFEEAARLHALHEKVQGVSNLAPELVHPLSELRAVVFQSSGTPDEVSVFLYQDGELRGPAPFSTLGMRIQNEQSGSSSLYAQPMAVEAVPETAPESEPGAPTKAPRGMLESRMESVLATLGEARPQPNSTVRQAHLALLTRWYYRPAQKRAGEVCFPAAAEPALPIKSWPIKSLRSMLRSVGRVAAAQLR